MDIPHHFRSGIGRGQSSLVLHLSQLRTNRRTASDILGIKDHIPTGMTTLVQVCTVLTEFSVVRPRGPNIGHGSEVYHFHLIHIRQSTYLPLDELGI